MAAALQFTISPTPNISALIGTGDASLLAGMRKGIGAAVAQELREHFEKLEAERSGKSDGLETGGTPTHFWIGVRDSVQTPQVAGEDISIGISHVAFRQRLLGGTITAGKGISSHTGKPTQFLAIPVDQESYGKRPGDFGEGALAFVVIPSLGPALVLAENNQRIATRGKSKGKSVPARGDQVATVGAGSVMFLLRHSVTQKPDPSVLPPEAEIIKTALEAGDAAAELFLARAGGTN